MTELLLAWLQAVGESTNSPLGLAVLMFCAGIEYVVPPFPGDMATVFAGILVSAYGWSLFLVFGCIMFGSLGGGLLAFALGRRWRSRRNPELAESSTRLTLLVERFRKRGSLYLLLNRFLPGVRPLFFVAAGLSGMSTWRVLALSSISALVWNSLLVLLGATLGHNLGRIEAWLKTYSLVVWGLMALIALGWLARHLLRRRAGAER